MIIDQINERLQEIRDCADDPEAAHQKEDKLYRLFITHVAIRPDDPELQEKARLVLSATQIKFSRWYG